VTPILAQQPGWIWEAKPTQDNTVVLFRKTFELEEAPQQAQLFLVADDVAFPKLNGIETSPNAGSLRTTRIDVTKLLKQGQNIITATVRNGASVAGLMARLEIKTPSKIIAINTDTTWKAIPNDNSTDWEQIGFDDSSWPNARLVGPPTQPPWGTLVDTKPFLIQIDSGAPTIPQHLQARAMLDDFADLSSWMGDAIKGRKPGHMVLPGQLGFGAKPDKSRPDGGTGVLQVLVVEDNSILWFEKNSVFSPALSPVAYEFDANPNNLTCMVILKLRDRFGSKTFTTKPCAIQGNQWETYRINVNSETIENFGEIAFPIQLRAIEFQFPKPIEGQILIDDLRAIIHSDKATVDIKPVYENLGNLPNQHVSRDFIFRNNRPTPLSGKATLRVKTLQGQQIRQVEHSINIPQYQVTKVSFQLGTFDVQGSYPLECTFDSENLQSAHKGWLGIFIPNNRRINSQPMWFGIEDQGIRNFIAEEEVHLEWMRQLGIDLLRANAIGTFLELHRGNDFGYQQHREVYKRHADANIDLLFSYAGSVPGWAGGPEINRYHEEFKEHIANLANFLATLPKCKYFEWFNEPNLGFFPGTTDDYLKSQQVIYPIIKKAAPHIKVTTGGLVISHPGAKKDFTKRVITENYPFYDIACYHGHEDTRSHLVNLKQLDQWLETIPDNKPTGNSEAGHRSYYADSGLAIIQANELVKKITITKARNAEYYIWFMLQDYADKYIGGDDSFGLVTVDNQPKPSFVAYNNMIRLLANTSPKPTAKLAEIMETFRFSGQNRDIYVWWSQSDKTTITLQATESIRKIDLYGNESTLVPKGGLVSFSCDYNPFYLECKPDAITHAPKTASKDDGDSHIHLHIGTQTPAVITLQNPEQLRELVFDPNIPR
jgi:hypothetical protein